MNPTIGFLTRTAAKTWRGAFKLAVLSLAEALWWVKARNDGFRYPLFAGYLYPSKVVAYAVSLYFRFPLSLRIVKKILTAQDIPVKHQTNQQ